MPGMTSGEPMTRGYAIAMKLCSPIVRRWARLDVEGLEHMSADGPLLLAGNHDSYWDPIAIGVAALPCRQIRALAKSSLWKIRGLGRILDSMGQIPVDRGKSDQRAMRRAIDELRAGACIGIFPEGTRSLGRELRARSGFGRLAAAVPEARVVCVAVSGTVDIPRFPKRPHVHVKFFSPAGGGLAQGEEAAALAVRLLTEIRGYAPIAVAGRKRRKALATTEAADRP